MSVVSTPIRRLPRELAKLSRSSTSSAQCQCSIARSLQRCERRTPTPPSVRHFSFRPALRRSTPKTTGDSSNATRLRRLPLLAAAGGVLTAALALAVPQSADSITDSDLSEQADDSSDSASSPDTDSSSTDDPPIYRLSEVKKHDRASDRPWVTYEDKIYDITDWLPAHPGGEVILRAAGGAIEPYWDIFAVHKQAYVREILDQYCVGRIHPDDLVDGRVPADTIEDPFRTDPTRDGRLLTITDKPRNAETPGAVLTDDFLTPNEVFYVRHHMWVPVVEDKEADEHDITIELPSGDSRTYTLKELKERFKHHTVTAVLQCSGNRRKDMSLHAAKTNGLQWSVGAISCAKWHGVKLRDVLADAGLSLTDPGEDAQHVQFSGLEAYGASIPIYSALDPRGDVLLAFRMNDRPLPRDHGFPLRVVVPGHVAARSVKWVNKIVVSDEESTTSWQRKDYKCFGPNEHLEGALDWDKYKSIQEMPITSAITQARFLTKTTIPTENAPEDKKKDTAEKRTIRLDGYAYSGGGREIQRVDVSLDGGKTWGQARLLDNIAKNQGSKAWCWKRWRYEGCAPRLDTEKGEKTEFVVKATDDAYNTQPEHYESIYNLRGNLATAWHRVIWDGKNEPVIDKPSKNV